MAIILAVILVAVVMVQSRKIKKLKKEVKELRKESTEFKKDADKFYKKWGHASRWDRV